MIIVTAQVEHSVDDVAHHLLLPGNPETFRLSDGFGYTHQKISLEAQILAGRAVVESDHIRGARMLQEILVHFGHEPG